MQSLTQPLLDRSGVWHLNHLLEIWFILGDVNGFSYKKTHTHTPH